MLDRLSFGHAAEFFSFLFVMGRSFPGGPCWKIHFPGPSLPWRERCVHAAYCRPVNQGQATFNCAGSTPTDGGITASGNLKFRCDASTWVDMDWLAIAALLALGFMTGRVLSKAGR